MRFFLFESSWKEEVKKHASPTALALVVAAFRPHSGWASWPALPLTWDHSLIKKVIRGQTVAARVFRCATIPSKIIGNHRQSRSSRNLFDCDVTVYFRQHGPSLDGKMLLFLSRCFIVVI